jgi:hypothetical protein
MDKHEAEDFFPERKVLRARQLPAMVDVPEDSSETRTQRVAISVSVSVAVFTPIFATAVVFGWMPLRLSLEIVLCAASFILVVGGTLAALKLRRAFLPRRMPLHLK